MPGPYTVSGVTDAQKRKLRAQIDLRGKARAFSSLPKPRTLESNTTN